MENIDEITKCFECNSRNITLDDNRGELFCEDCGVVLDEDMMESTSSGREKTNDPNSIQTHSRNRQGFTLGSEVGTTNIDGSLDRSKLGRTLRRMNTRNKLTSYEKNATKGIVQCNMLAAEFGLGPQLREQVIWTYKKLLKDGVLAGLSLETRAAAILYYIFRDNGISRNLIEVCNANNAHPRQVAKGARKIARHFRKPWVLSQRNITQEIQKYCDQLGTNTEYTASAIRIGNIMHQIAEDRCMNVSKGFTAGCIYAVTQLSDMNVSYRTQCEISDVVGITEVTLRTNYKKMLKMVNLSREKIKELTMEEFMEGAYEYVSEE